MCFGPDDCEVALCMRGNYIDESLWLPLRMITLQVTDPLILECPRVCFVDIGTNLTPRTIPYVAVTIFLYLSTLTLLGTTSTAKAGEYLYEALPQCKQPKIRLKEMTHFTTGVLFSSKVVLR